MTYQCETAHLFCLLYLYGLAYCIYLQYAISVPYTVQQVIALKTQLLRRAEERAKYVEQQLLEMKVQNDGLQQQSILQSQQTDDRIKTAEMKAIRADQELLEPKKQNEADNLSSCSVLIALSSAF